MKRREFVWASAGMTGLLLPRLGAGQSQPCPPPTLSATGGTSTSTSCSPGSAQADWDARSIGPGVVWAHDFTYPDEFSAFDYTAATITLPYVRATSRVASGGPNDKPFLRLLHPAGGPLLDVTGMQWVSSNANDGCRATVSLGGNTLASAGIVAGDWVQFVNMPEDNRWEWFNPHSSGFGNNLYVQVLSIVNATQFIVSKPQDMQGTTPASFPTFSAPNGCAVHRCRMPSGRWARTMCAYNAGFNGKPTPDPAANGSVTRRSWSSIQMMNGTVGSRNAGMYGNAVYHKSWTKGLNGTTMSSTDWDGDEWYLQFRVRLSSSRLDRGQPGGKLMLVEYTTDSCDGEIVPQTYGKYPAPNSPNWKTGSALFGESVTIPWYAYADKQQFIDLAGDYTTVPSRIEAGSAWASTCLKNRDNGASACWWWPFDEWVTILMHFKPGRDSGNSTHGWSGATTAYPETWFRVWAARAGQDYTPIFDRRNFEWGWYNDPPGFNLFSFSSYMNNIAGTDAFTQDFAEIVFSKQFIPAPTT